MRPLDDEDADGDSDAATVADVAEGATEVAAPGARRRAPGAAPAADVAHDPASPIARHVAETSAAPTRADTSATPVAVLHQEEIARTRVFLTVALGIVAAVTAALPVVGGDPIAKRWLGAGLLVVAIAAGGLRIAMRDPRRYTEGSVTVAALASVFGAYTGIYFWGVFSPAPAIVVLGIYFFSLGRSLRATVLVYALCALAQAALSALVIAGVAVDRGLIHADHLDRGEMIATQVIVQVLYAAAYLLARSTRRATLSAITQLERAVRGLAQREALLAEARADLDRVLGVGGAGRYTEQTLGSFRLGGVIGRGAMGEVYEAQHVATTEPAAVKLLHPSVLTRPDHVARFVREARAAAALSARNVVRVLEVGDPSVGVPYLAMERLRGQDLAHLLRKRRRLPLDRVLDLVRQVAGGLEAARAAGIVHRDIKPQNLFLAEREAGAPEWKILDFGVATLGDHRGTLTHGQVVGTPAYMAPEQARGEPVDHRADVYSLAAIAYRALTGQPPFTGRDVPALLFEVVYRMPVRPGGLVELPRGVDEVLLLGLAKGRDDRFRSAAALSEALAAAAGGELAPALAARAEALHAELPWGAAR